MSALCSFLIPTRTGSKESLQRTIDGITKEASPGTDFEILLRVDDDDPQRIKDAGDMIDGRGAVIVGPRRSGYGSVGTFIDELAKVSDSQWSCFMDDDMWFVGNWANPLRSMPQDNARAFNAEHYYLGKSYYPNKGKWSSPIGLFMPTAHVKTITHRTPVDDCWLGEIQRLGWPIEQIPGLSLYHDGRAR